MKRIFFLSLFFISTFGFVQAPSIEWQQSIGGTGDDYAYSIQQTTDGGYIVAGYSESNNGYVTGNNGLDDYWIAKLDEVGNMTWQKTLGGSGIDRAISIQQTMDGGYIVSGKSDSNNGDVTGNHGGKDYWVVKLDATGNMTWQKSLGGSGDDQSYSLQQTTDGGYIVVGASNSNDGDVTDNNGGKDCWVVKLDTSGNIVWQKSYGGSLTDLAAAVQQTKDGGYIVAGSTRSDDGDVTDNNGGYDFWAIKLDATGNMIWQKSLGGSGTDSSGSVQQTSDGGFILTGNSISNDGDLTGNNGWTDLWVVRLDESGNLIWQKSLGSSGTDIGLSVQQTTDGGYIVGGLSSSNDGDVIGNNGFDDFWIVKLDTTGNIIWQKSLGGSDADQVTSIQQTTDGGYIAGGFSSSNDGDVIGNNGGYDFWIVKLNPEISSINEIDTIETLVYPNPTVETITISSEQEINSSFKIIDAKGKLVLVGNMKGKEQSVDVSKLTRGMHSIVFDNSALPVLSVIKK